MLFTSWNTVLTPERWGRIHEIMSFVKSFLELFKRKIRIRGSHFSLSLPLCSSHPSFNHIFSLLPLFFMAILILSFLSFPLLTLYFFQPAVVAGSPGRLLRSARFGLQCGRPAVVQLHTARATDPGESPHPSPPGQGHLHGQATPGGRRGRRGQGWSSSRRRIAATWAPTTL